MVLPLLVHDDPSILDALKSLLIIHTVVQEPALFVGRIVCDSEGRLNAESCVLEGTLQHSQGRSVKLSLDNLPSYRLFPGQVLLQQYCTSANLLHV